VILSNVCRKGFASSNKKLGVQFDAVYTAQDIGSYKPDPNNFDYLLKHIKPAKKAGLARCWIDRQNLDKSENWGATAVVHERPDTDYRFNTLMEMAEYMVSG